MSIQSIASMLFGSERDLFFTFKADSHDDLTFRVVDFSVEEGLSSPFTIQLTLASEKDHLTEDDIVDKFGVLTLYRNQMIERYFHGVVFAFSKGDTGRHHTFYKMTLVPSFARLSLRTNSRIFQGKTVMDITEELLGEMGITDYGLSIRNSHEPREFCVQYCESDQAFIERLLAEEGIFYYFEHEKDKHTIVFADDNSVVDEIPFPVLYNNHSGGLAEFSSIRKLAAVAKVKPTDVVLNDYSFKQPSSDFKKSAYGDNTDYQNNYEHYMYPGRYKDHGVGEAFTKTRVNHLRSDAKTIEGEGDVAQLTTGYMFMVLDHPSIMVNKKWMLTHIQHQGTQPQSLDNAGGEGITQYSNKFSALPKEQQWKPEPLPKPHIYGPQIGKVVGPEGEEIYTDEFGRVKVQFPWDRYGKSDEGSSCWIRVTQDWAGGRYGGVMLPRIGHEIVVSFLEGDPDQPIITGRAFHVTNRQNYALPALKTLASIKSKEHKSGGYGELLLDDTTGEIKTQVHSTHGTTQLTMGYLTHPRKSDGTGEHRGDGFELRTDEWGAIRAGKGLYISSDIREKASDEQLDLEEAIEQLEKALEIARELARGQKEAGIMPSNETDDQEERLKDVFDELKKPGLLLSSPEGIAAVSPESIQLSTQTNIALTAEENTVINAFNDAHMAANNALSIFAVEDTLSMVANKGAMKIEAQANNMDVIANRTLKVLSTEDQVIIAADKEILITSGKAYIRLKDGNIDVHAPGIVDHKAASFPFNGPTSLDYDMPTFQPVSLCVECLKKAAKEATATMEVL